MEEEKPSSRERRSIPSCGLNSETMSIVKPLQGADSVQLCAEPERSSGREALLPLPLLH